MKKINKVTNMSYQYDTYDELLKHSWDMLGNKWEIENFNESELIVHYKKIFV